jgi:hypothetical protein
LPVPKKSFSKPRFSLIACSTWNGEVRAAGLFRSIAAIPRQFEIPRDEVPSVTASTSW